ncbi:hypothetical protein BKA70DRAFT_1437423 [Coprinopsis sp. MPI-PUGE-AT-0042]|nr:hypothetical protein BKA70DRAFT_1437423 [Coprinopsis sp. MPI-PUGE-AT-0042]
MLKSLLQSSSTVPGRHVVRAAQEGTPIIYQPRAVHSESIPQAQTLPSLHLQLELVEETISRRRLLLSSPKPEYDPEERVDPSTENTAVFIDLTTLGLESVLPPDSKDFTVAAIKLATSSRARDAMLSEIDTTLATLRDQVDRYNSANDDVAFSSDFYDAVKARYQRTPKVGEFMQTLLNTLVPRQRQAA